MLLHPLPHGIHWPIHEFSLLLVDLLQFIALECPDMLLLPCALAVDSIPALYEILD